MFCARPHRICRRPFAVGRVPPKCWRRNGSTRIWRCRTRTISISCGWRFGSRPTLISTARHARRSAISPRIMREQIEAGAAHGLNPLVANFGPAQLDRAILDALFLSLGVRSMTACATISPVSIRALLGGRVSDLAGFDMPRFLAQLTPSDSHRRAPHRRLGRRHWRPSGTGRR